MKYFDQTKIDLNRELDYLTEHSSDANLTDVC